MSQITYATMLVWAVQAFFGRITEDYSETDNYYTCVALRATGKKRKEMHHSLPPGSAAGKNMTPTWSLLVIAACDCQPSLLAAPQKDLIAEKPQFPNIFQNIEEYFLNELLKAYLEPTY